MRLIFAGGLRCGCTFMIRIFIFLTPDLCTKYIIAIGFMNIMGVTGFTPRSHYAQILGLLPLLARCAPIVDVDRAKEDDVGRCSRCSTCVLWRERRREPGGLA